jgi:hypothetical protein
MKTGLFIKTYPGDFRWLAHCLESIRRNLTGHAGLVIVIDQGTWGQFEREIPADLRKVANDILDVGIPEGANGYLWQQVIKLTADSWCPEDWTHIAPIDSDCIFLPGANIGNHFDADGRSIWLWNHRREIPADHPWFGPTERWLGNGVTKEFMRAHPHIIPRGLLAAVRAHTQRLHGKSIADYIMGAGQFSEFNALGAYAWERRKAEPFNIHFREAREINRTLVQFWSWGGIDKNLDAVAAAMEGRPA